MIIIFFLWWTESQSIEASKQYGMGSVIYSRAFGARQRATGALSLLACYRMYLTFWAVLGYRSY